jgi:hypothetical protein
VVKDPNVRAEIEREWRSIRAMVNWNRSGSLPGGGYINETPPEEFYNLPFVLAYSVLDDVLAQMIVEHIFKCAKKNGYCFNLGDKMLSSKRGLSWKDYATVDAGRKRRNDVAHNGILHSKEVCVKYINAVEDELRNWGLFV